MFTLCKPFQKCLCYNPVNMYQIAFKSKTAKTHSLAFAMYIVFPQKQEKSYPRESTS